MKRDYFKRQIGTEKNNKFIVKFEEVKGVIFTYKDINVGVYKNIDTKCYVSVIIKENNRVNGLSFIKDKKQYNCIEKTKQVIDIRYDEIIKIIEKGVLKNE